MGTCRDDELRTIADQHERMRLGWPYQSESASRPVVDGLEPRTISTRPQHQVVTNADYQDLVIATGRYQMFLAELDTLQLAQEDSRKGRTVL